MFVISRVSDSWCKTFKFCSVFSVMFPAIAFMYFKQRTNPSEFILVMIPFANSVHSRSKRHVRGDSLFYTHAQCRSVHRHFFVNIKIYCEFNIFITGVDLWQLKSV